MIDTVTLNMCLCDGRHNIPSAVDGAIFGETIHPRCMRSEGYLEDHAYSAILRAAMKYGGAVYSDDSTDDLNIEQFKPITINLYVTGLTVALIAVLNTCKRHNIPVTLYHYDRDTGDYFPQPVA